MKWTSEFPKKEGYYWYSPNLNPKHGRKVISIRRIFRYNGPLAMNWEYDRPILLSDYARQYMSTYDVWAGPIPEPEEFQ